MTSHCESCTYFDDHQTNSGKQADGEGLCRFNPPISQPAPDAHGLWPVVGEKDWCGHYAAESAAAQHAA